MNFFASVYRKASRELALPKGDRAVLMSLLRELATSTVRRRLAWNLKTDFLTLWFVSAGRFPHLPTQITTWFITQLPFSLTHEEQQILYL